MHIFSAIIVNKFSYLLVFTGQANAIINVQHKFRSPDDLLKVVRPHLNVSLVESYNVIYKFVLEGENGGVFYLDLKNGEFMHTMYRYICS